VRGGASWEGDDHMIWIRREYLVEVRKLLHCVRRSLSEYRRGFDLAHSFAVDEFLSCGKSRGLVDWTLRRRYFEKGKRGGHRIKRRCQY